MSEAYFTALTELRDRLQHGELDGDDLVFTVDADGQHDLHVLNELVEMTIAEGLDANLARRDLSYHGPFKRTGNWVLSKWASAWAGTPLLDVESGYRIFRLGALAHALDYYSGYKYSETVEVAVVLCQLGYKVRNDHLVPVPVARSRTRMRDALIDMSVIPIAAGRVWHRDRVREALPTDAVAHVALAGILGLLCSFTYAQATDTMLTLILAAIAAFGLGSTIRRFVPRPSLSLLGALLALVAAWLVPQRPDMGSAIVLAALFGVGASLAAPPVRRPRPLVLAGAFVVFVVVRIGGTRATLLGLAVVGVAIAALAARFGRIAMPGRYRMRTLAVGSILVVTTSGITGYFGASTVGATWFGGGVTHGPRGSDAVAITFDDGPNTEATPAIMKILDDAGVKGSFFVVGKALDAEPQIVRDLYAHGHLVGNHSYHHDDWRWLDPRYPELARTQDAFARNIGKCPVWFRPPHGQKTPMMARVVHEHHMHIALWDVSVADWSAADPDAVAANVLDACAGRVDHRPARRVRRQAVDRSLGGRQGTPEDPRRSPGEAPPAGAPGSARGRPHVPAVHPARHVTDAPRSGLAESEASRRTDHVVGSRIALAVFVVAWVVLLAVYLRHAIVFSSDSVNNHVHVWHIARDLWHHGRLPWRFPQLGHGEAYAYPYGFVNWTTAALAWPLFGNWAVTLWTVLGVVGCIVATFVAFPELRRGWWAAAVLANPAIVQALLFGQQSFAWGAMFMLFAIAAWRRGARGWAMVLLGIGFATHPYIVAPLALVVLLLCLPFTRDRSGVIKWYVVACVIAVPAVVIVFISPSASDSRPSTQIVNFLSTLGPRVFIAVLPIFYVLLRRLAWSWLAPVALAVSLILLVALSFPLNVWAQWRVLAWDGVDTASLDAYLRSPSFVRGATYRVLRGGDGKLGLYHVVQAGGRLDSEMFPETMAIRDFHDVADYEKLLCDRHIDQIMHFDSYDASRHTNEREMIARLAADSGDRVHLEELARGTNFEIYAVDRSGCESVRAAASMSS